MRVANDGNPASTLATESISNGPVVTSNVDVIVIGAGPAGLMAAMALTRAGVSVRIVDKRAQKVMVGHADGGQARTMEVLHSYGLLDVLRKDSYEVVVQAFYAYNTESKALELHQRTPSCVGPPGRFIGRSAHQGTYEQMFISDLAQHDVHVERPAAPTSLKVSTEPSVLADPQAYAVQVSLPTPDGGEEIVHAKYAIGGDGARSWVREALNIPVEGENTEYVWGVQDIIPKTDFPDIRHLSVMQSPVGSCLIVPRERGLIRLYVQLENKPELFDASGAIIREKVNSKMMLEVANASIKPYTIEAEGDPEWWSVYRIRQGVADRYASPEGPHGRVFITGDACHTHSPKAGQGMNASINDSHNLAWKLAHVLRGWAKPELLQTYADERREYARKLIAFDKVWASAVSKRIKTHPDDTEGITREELMQLVWTFGSFQSGIGIRYDAGILTSATHQHLAEKIVVGERLPHGTIVCAASGQKTDIQELAPSNGRWKVIIMAGDLQGEKKLAVVRAAAAAIQARFPTQHHLGKASKSVEVEAFVLGHGLDLVEMAGALQTAPGLDWLRIYGDTADAWTAPSGELHAKFDVVPEGVAVVVRPDGYVGMLAPLGDGLDDSLRVYFGGFLA